MDAITGHPSTATPLPERRRMRTRKFWAIVMALIIFGAASSLTLLDFERSECVIGHPVKTVPVYTPVELMNNPYGGNTYLNMTLTPTQGNPVGPMYSVSSGGLTVISRPLISIFASVMVVPGPDAHNYSQVGGAFRTFNWTVYPATNQTTFTFGAPTVCTDRYVAAATIYGPQDGMDFITVNVTNNTTDASEAHFPSIPVGATLPPNTTMMWFENGFVSANYPEVDTCGKTSPTVITINGTVSVPISFTTTIGNQNVTIDGRLYWTNQGQPANHLIGATMTYVFPANFGIWQIYSPSGTNTPGALAFQYHPC